MQRITQKHLHYLLERVNLASSNVYDINFYNGGCQLVVNHENGGQSNIGFFDTKRQVYNALCMLNDYIVMED
jgi:hypothetical protein